MRSDQAGPATLADAKALPVVMKVPAAGRTFWNLGRSASYAAAARGDMPTIRVGRRLVVPTALMLSKIGLEP